VNIRAQAARLPTRSVSMEASPARVSTAVRSSAVPVVDKAHRALDEVPVLRARSLVKRWGRKAPPVLAGAELTLRPGEFVAIVGRNGVGKTTLLRILCGLIDAEEGSVRVGGLSPRRDRRRFHQSVSFLPATNTGLYARLTVRQNLDLWSRLALLPRVRRGDAVDAALQDFALAELAPRRADRLSMGQRQRVRLALATLHGPRVLLLDEPVNSLDGDGVGMLLSVLERHRRAGGCAVWCAPEVDGRALGLDRSLTLREGRLV
jgi:ABC-type multidrug transport system ATPase subunit